MLPQEPGAEPRPAPPPPREGLVTVILRRRERVGEVPLSGQPQHHVETAPLHAGDCLSNLDGRDHQLADKPLEVVDERVLVGQECLKVNAMEVDRALQAAHKRLRLRGQLIEPDPQGGQVAVDLAAVRCRLGGQVGKFAEQIPDIPERGSLQLARLAQGLVEHGERPLSGLSCRGKLVQ
jgi:hypothetical protein